MIQLKFEGYEIGGTGHDITKDEWKKLSNKERIEKKILFILLNK